MKRDSYCSLIGSTDQNNTQLNSNNYYQQSPHSLSTHKRSNIIKCAHKGKVKLGIKQFDMVRKRVLQTTYLNFKVEFKWV